jgi:hypothetical protein
MMIGTARPTQRRVFRPDLHAHVDMFILSVEPAWRAEGESPVLTQDGEREMVFIQGDLYE